MPTLAAAVPGRSNGVLGLVVADFTAVTAIVAAVLTETNLVIGPAEHTEAVTLAFFLCRTANGA